MYRSSDNFDAVQTVLDNTLPVHAHCGGHSTDTTPLPCYFPEPFDPAGCVISPLVGPTDASSRVRHVPADHVTGIQLYSEVQRNGQVTTSTERPSSMRACPSAASVLSYARSDTDSSANGPACRICDSAGDGSNRLISPCRCSGTSKFVHEQCLNVSSCALIRFLRFIDYFISLLLGCAFSALTLSVGWQEGHPAYKTLYTHTRLTTLCPGLPRSAGTRKVKPIWILLKQVTVSGSGISWAICQSAPRSRQVLPFWYRLTWVVPEKGLLNGCLCV